MSFVATLAQPNPQLQRPVREVIVPALSLERLADITDWYAWDVPDLAHAVSTATVYCGDRNTIPVAGSEVAGWLRGLLDHVRRKHAGEEDFRVVYEDGGERYLFRGHRDDTVEGVQLALRRHPSVAPRLEDLNIPALWRDLFLRASLLRGGLILIAAVTGQGKSTTISSIVTSRLHQYGGYCRAVEDPPELPLHGQHGTGRCIQTPVKASDGEQGFAKALRSAMRSYPALTGGGTICVVGEVRDSETAAELLRAAVNGHLVLTTIHAPDVPSALARMAALAEGVMGAAMARELLGAALVHAIHQTLEFDPRETGWRRGKIGGSLLTSTGPASAAATSIRDGRFPNLAQPLDQQAHLMRNARNAEEFIARLDGGVR